MGEREHLLLADDDQGNLQTIELSLLIAGHDVVVTCKSVAEVRAFINSGQAGKITVALMDGDMPRKGDGETAANLLRQANPKVYIISLSSDPQNFGDRNFVKGIEGMKPILKEIESL